MRAAAAVGKDRAQGFEIMTMEAWKIKNEAEYAAQIRATVLPDATEPAPEEAYEPGSGSEFDEEEPWLATFVDKKPMEPPERGRRDACRDAVAEAGTHADPSHQRAGGEVPPEESSPSRSRALAELPRGP